jgi:hypothetical protein
VQPPSLLKVQRRELKSGVCKSPQPTGEPNAYANVYANISIDYSKLHVTPDIMMAVLSGNAAGSHPLGDLRLHNAPFALLSLLTSC